jgi:hypothetical protein
MTDESTQIIAPPGPRRTGRLVVIAVTSAVALVAVAGGAFAAYTTLSGGGAQPHDVVPASVEAYARLDVDPSASQKIALLKLIRKFPDAAKSIGIKNADQDVRKLVFDELVPDTCPDVDYKADVKPWLGERIGVGVQVKDETAIVAVQVTDEKKARAGIKSLFKCAGEKYGIAFLDGYALLSEDQKAVDQAVKDAQRAPLGDDKEFVADFESLGDQGVASAWVDLDALADIPELQKATAADMKSFEQAGSLASTLRVDGSAVEIAAVSGITDANKVKAAPLGELPADTVVGLSFGGVGKQVSDQYDTFLKEFSEDFTAGFEADTVDPSITEDMTPQEGAAFEQHLKDNPIEAPAPDDLIAELEKSTGLRLPQDLETFFGDGLMLAIGSKNLEKLPTVAEPSDIRFFDVALALTSDPAKALDLVKRLADLAEQGGVELVTAGTDDGAILATNRDAADAMVDDGGRLGDEKVFTSVMPYGNDTLGGFYVNVGAIVDKISQADLPEDVAADIEEANALEAVGFSAANKGDHTVASFRVRLAD